jgi:protease-4
MGTVAASGGYYVATPGAWVVAHAGTITGSIGVLSGKLVHAPLLAKLGIHGEWVDRGDGISLQRGDHRYTEAERKTVWRGIRRTYDLFLERVAEARGLSTEEVDAIGGGRVWTGRQALERGLVDQLGGLEEAIAKARSLAGLHPRAPVRDVVERGADTAPVPGSGGEALRYVLDGMRPLRGSAPLCLCPLVVDAE